MLLLLLSRFSRVQLCVTPWTAAYQASPSMGFSRQEHWSGLPFTSPTYTLPYVNQRASGNLLYDARSSTLVLRDNLEWWKEWEVEGKLKREGIYIYLGPIHVDMWQIL